MWRAHAQHMQSACTQYLQDGARAVCAAVAASHALPAQHRRLRWVEAAHEWRCWRRLAVSAWHDGVLPGKLSLGIKAAGAAGLAIHSDEDMVLFYLRVPTHSAPWPTANSPTPTMCSNSQRTLACCWAAHPGGVSSVTICVLNSLALPPLRAGASMSTPSLAPSDGL